MPRRTYRENAALIGRLFPSTGGFVLTKNITRRLAIPHEEGQWMELRRLSWTQLDSARRDRTNTALKQLAEQPDDVKELMRSTTAQRQAVAEAAVDPLAEYHMATLLELGIYAWSYDEPVTSENIADLDSETAQWAALEIVKPASRTPEDRADRLFPVAPGA